MKTIKQMNKIYLFILTLTFHFSVSGQSLYEDPYQWKIPGGKYVDPVSFFSLHGYVNALYAGHRTNGWRAALMAWVILVK